MLPVTLALAVGQINTLVDRIIASTCQEGAVSALYYADRLLELLRNFWYCSFNRHSSFPVTVSI